jgi:histidinol-phosphatase
MAYGMELEAALEAAHLAGETALGYWRTGLRADTKQDDSPVTAADRHCERLLVQHLCHLFPSDGVLGEEGAEKASANGRRWILDPIDGTRDFLRGNRLWSMLIGLEDNGEVVAGVAHFPALGETYAAAQGAGATRNGEPIRSSSISEISQSVLCVNSFQNAHRLSFHRNLFDWMKAFWAVRSLGGALDAMLVASGSAEAWIEQSAKPWDLAALKIISEEAGARFFNFDGGNSIYGGNCVICVPPLETAMRRFVSA